jgi:integrase
MKTQQSDGLKNSRIVPKRPSINPTVKSDGVATLSEPMKQFQKSPSGRTLVRQKHSVKLAQFWLDNLGADTPLEEVAPSAVRRILNGLDISGSTKNRYVAALSVLYKIAAVDFDYDGPNPTRKMVKWPENGARVRSLNKAEVSALLDACKMSRWPKLRLLVLMAVTTGMRRGSLMGIRHSDIDIKSGRIVIDRTKNGTPYVAILTDSALAELRPWHREGSDELLFKGKTTRGYTLDKEYRKAVEKAGMGADVVFHTLRHTAASMAAQSGASTLQIMDLLNHKTPVMAARYAHLNITSRQTLVGSVFSDIR